MAIKYWYKSSNGSDNWATASNWYLGSGGTGGTTTVPTATDDVILDSNSGTGTITIAAAATCASLDCTGFRGTLAGTSTLAVSTSTSQNYFYFGASMSLTYSGTITFTSTSNPVFFLTNGKTLTCNITIALTAGVLFYFGDLGTVNFASTTTLTLTSGIIGFSGPSTLNVGLFVSTGAVARGIFGPNGYVFTFNIIGIGTVWNVSGTLFGVNISVYITDQSSSTKIISHTPTTTIAGNDPNGSAWSFIIPSMTITGSGIGAYTLTGNLGSINFNNTLAAPVSFGTSNIYGTIDFSNSYANLNNGATTITFNTDSVYFIIGPYVTITASPIITVSNPGTDYVYFANYGTQSLTQGISINGNGTYTGIFCVSDFRFNNGTLTLTKGIFVSGYNTYIGFISTSNTNVRTFNVGGTLYLTGAGATIPATTTTNLTWSTYDVYVISSSVVARSLIFNSVIYPTNGSLYLSGSSSGAITYSPAVGTPQTFAIYVTNTGGAAINISTTTNIYVLDFTTSNVVWNNTAIVVTFFYLYLSPNMTITACPTLTWNGSGLGEIRCYGKSLTNLTINDTNLTGQILYITGDLYVSGVLTLTSGNITAQNTQYGAVFSGLDRGFAGPSYSIGYNEDVYVGSLTVNGTFSTQVKNWTSKDVYFTASGTLLTATSFANLSWSVNNMNVVVKDAVARSISPNSTIYPSGNTTGTGGNLYISGTGSATTTITPGTFGGYDVMTTNTGSGVISFVTGTIRSLTFASGNTVWNNAITQTLTIQGSLTVYSAGNFILTPSLIFTGYAYYYNGGISPTITMGGKALVTGTVTINDPSYTPATGGVYFTFLDTFTLNSAFTITSAAYVQFIGKFIGTSTTISLVATGGVEFDSSCSVSSTITTTNSATYSNGISFYGTASFTTLTHNGTGTLGFAATASFTTLSVTNVSSSTYVAGPLIASTSIVLTNGTSMTIGPGYYFGFPNYVNYNNLIITCPTFTMTNGNLNLYGTASITGALTLTTGSINMSQINVGGYILTDLSIGSFTSTGAVTRSITSNYGTNGKQAKLNITGTGSVWNVSGSNFTYGSLIYVTDSSATGKTLAHSPTSDLLSVTTTGSGTGSYTLTGNFATVLFNNTSAATVTFGTSTIYLIDFGTSINNWNNGAVTVTFNQLYLSPNMTVTVCPTLLWNGVIVSTSGQNGEIRCYGKSITNLTVNDTTLLNNVLYITGDLYISGTLTLISGNINANNSVYGGTFSGIDRGFAGPTYSYFAYEDMYLGNFTSAAGSATRSILCKNMYFTSVTATTLTSTTNLGISIDNMYLTNSSGAARAITLSTGFYPNYAVYIAGTAAGTTTITPATQGTFDVIITNTGAAVISFTTGTIKSLIFATGSNAIWTNAITQTLTIQGNMTVYSAGNFTLTPALIFNASYYSPITIRMGGKSLVTGAVTLNDTNGSYTFQFLDSFSLNSAFTITNAGIVTFATASSFTGTTLTITNANIVTFNGTYSGTTIAATTVNNLTFNAPLTLTSTLTTTTTVGMTINATASFTALAQNSAGTVTVNGPLTASTSITLNNASAVLTHTGTITTPALTITNGSLISNGTLTLTGTGILTLTTGTIQVNGSNNYNLGSFTSTGTTVRTITMGNGTWTLSQPGTGVVPWNINSTNLSFNAGASLILINDSNNPGGNMTFTGAGLNYYGVQFNRVGSTYSITISGSNGFVNFIDTGNLAHTLFFTAATTQTIGNFVVNGSPSAIIQLRSATNAAYTLQKSPAGLVNCDYLLIQYSNALPSTGTWYAGTNSNNNLANSGWIFTNIPPRKLGAGGIG